LNRFQEGEPRALMRSPSQSALQQRGSARFTAAPSPSAGGIIDRFPGVRIRSFVRMMMRGAVQRYLEILDLSGALFSAMSDFWLKIGPDRRRYRNAERTSRLAAATD
jgi:hypothetical protein